MSNPLYDLMHKGESGAAGYNAYNRGTAVNSKGQEYIVPGRPPMDFSTLTLGQVSELQHLNRRDPDRVFAIGKYQIIPRTMDGAINYLGLDRNQRFSPELQDRIFSEYLIVQKRPDIHGYITGKPGATLKEAQFALACEWASFSDPNKGDLRSHYGSGNHASISLKESENALNAMRAEYAKNIAEGMSPKDAWKATIGNTAQPSKTQPDQNPQQTPQRQPSANPLADGVLKRGEGGEVVVQFQKQLNALGYVGANGKPLDTSVAHFGPNTEHAVKAFQTAHGIQPVDGKIGKDTIAAFNDAKQHPLVSEATHPNHALYAAIAKQLPPGTKPEAIANVTLQAMENGMTDASKLGKVSVKDGDAFVMPAGSFGGNWIKVDLSAPTASLKAMSDHMAGETKELQQQNQRQTTQATEQNRPGPVMV